MAEALTTERAPRAEGGLNDKSEGGESGRMIQHFPFKLLSKAEDCGGFKGITKVCGQFSPCKGAKGFCGVVCPMSSVSQ